MMRPSEAIPIAQGLLERGEIKDAAEANVCIVQMMGVRLITSKIPRETRSALMAAVKRGEIGHLPKDELRPEAFFHKNGRANALDARDRAAMEAVKALAIVCGRDPREAGR